MGTLNRSQFKFQKHDHVGCPGAEEDYEYLDDCFVDVGDLAVLRDPANSLRVIVGRTGSGKTALLEKLRRTEKHCASLDPRNLALQYLENSTIIRYLEELGVRLEIFYRLLWRHILAVELIKLKYDIHNEQGQQTFLQRLTGLFRNDRQKAEALNYLVEWGQSFWKETEARVHEVTSRLESDLKSSLGARFSILQAGSALGTTLSEEDKTQIVDRAQVVVNKIQLQRLSRVIELLGSDIFAEKYPHYFVLIDGLDEDWVADSLKMRLIRALLETVKELQAIRSAKVIVAIRKDLLDRVFRATRDASTLEEKFQSLVLRLSWRDDQLLKLLDLRIGQLVRRRYTSTPVGWQDVFPSKINKQPTAEYILQRTMSRPRDVIHFVNCCIDLATDSPEISAAVVRAAESDYAAQRLRFLSAEWRADYPELIDAASVLRQRPPRFVLTEISDQDLEGLALRLMEKSYPAPGKLGRWWIQLLDGSTTPDSVRPGLTKMFYEAGILGIRCGVNVPVSWSFRDRDLIRTAEILPESRLEICPAFYRVLGTNTRSER